jgi:hydrophobic/amphiphilic exporter-1 (mainly G- bacteria), HAE1 family
MARRQAGKTMQKLAEICIKRPIFASMIILALVVVGIAAYNKLGVDRYPSVDMPTVSVRTTLVGASAELVETDVTEMVEEAVNTVQGISELTSTSGPGSSMVRITFELNRDINVATQDVRDRVAAISRRLQMVGADPPVITKFNADNQPVMTIALAGPRTQKELGEIADKIVKVQVERAEGVGEVAIVGGLERAISIWVDADKLAALQLPVTIVRDAVVRQNADIPGGNMTNSQEEKPLRVPARLKTAADFEKMVITKINGQVIHLSDVARVEDGTKEQRSLSLLNGDPTVVLEIRRQSGENTVATIDAVKAAMVKARELLPADVRMEVIRDQSKYIRTALEEINIHLVLGAVFACLVVLAFMRNARSTFIAGIAIPTSLVSTFGLMWWLGFTLNSVTMLALVLMVGVVIDDAIVVLENIFRFVEEKKMKPFDAAREATKEIGLAVLATTLSLVVIFVPVSFMSSVSGRFLYQFGITAAAAVMVSLLVSFTLTPMMSARLLKAGNKGHGEAANSRRGFYHLIDTAYTWLLRLSMRWRFVVAVLGLAVMATSFWIYPRVKREFVPTDVDEAEFGVNFTAPEATSVAAMTEAIRGIDQEVRQVRGVTVVLTSIGGGYMGSVNTASMYVRIEPHEKRLFSLGRLWTETLQGQPLAAFKGNYTQRDVMNDLRRRLVKYRADLRPVVRNFPSINIGGGPVDIEFVFKGPELTKLSEYAEGMRAMTLPPPGGGAPALPSVMDADTSLKLNKPELHVVVDRARADDLGISPADIGEALGLLVGGNERVSRFRDEAMGEAYDVQIRLEPKDRSRAEQLEGLFLPRRGAGDGNLVEFANIAKVETVPSPSRIERLDRQRTISLRGSAGIGYAQGDAIQALREAAEKMNLPRGYTTTVTGRAREFERTFVEFLWAFLLSVIFMYIILASQYESLVHPLTILLSLPLSVPFALLSLWATGGTLNLYSALGILVLFGVVKKNAILQIDHMNGLRRKGMPRAEAIIQGNRDRLRPILMTTLALVAGMMPLWLGVGPGSEERRAVAVVVIGGQTLSLLLTLLVTPVVYSYLDDIGAFVLGRREKAAVAVAEPAAVENGVAEAVATK